MSSLPSNAPPELVAAVHAQNQRNAGNYVAGAVPKAKSAAPPGKLVLGCSDECERERTAQSFYKNHPATNAKKKEENDAKFALKTGPLNQRAVNLLDLLEEYGITEATYKEVTGSKVKHFKGFLAGFHDGIRKGEAAGDFPARAPVDKTKGDTKHTIPFQWAAPFHYNNGNFTYVVQDARDATRQPAE